MRICGVLSCGFGSEEFDPMRTRKGACYSSPHGGCRRDSKRGREGGLECSGSKRKMHMNHLDALSDDLLLSILVKLSSSAGRPTDLISALVACKRFNEVGTQPMVLQNASTPVFAMEACRWSEGSHRFLKKCTDAGNVEACYTLVHINVPAKAKVAFAERARLEEVIRLLSKEMCKRVIEIDA